MGIIERPFRSAIEYLLEMALASLAGISFSPGPHALTSTMQSIFNAGPFQAIGAGILGTMFAYELIMILSRSNTLNDIDVGTYVRWVIKCVIGFFFFSNAANIATGLTSVASTGNLGAFSNLINEAETIARSLAVLVMTYGLILIGLGIHSNNAEGINKGAMTIAGGALLMGVGTIFGMVPSTGGGAFSPGGGAVSAASINISGLLEDMGIGMLLVMFLMALFFVMFTAAVPAMLEIVIFAMAIEMAIYIAMAPIPLATMANDEFSEIGRGYLKKCIALGLRFAVIAGVVAIMSPVAAHFLTLIGGATGVMGSITAIIMAIAGIAAVIKMLFGAKEIANSLVGV